MRGEEGGPPPPGRPPPNHSLGGCDWVSGTVEMSKEAGGSVGEGGGGEICSLARSRSSKRAREPLRRWRERDRRCDGDCKGGVGSSKLWDACWSADNQSLREFSSSALCPPGGPSSSDKGSRGVCEGSPAAGDARRLRADRREANETSDSAGDESRDRKLRSASGVDGGGRLLLGRAGEAAAAPTVGFGGGGCTFGACCSFCCLACSCRSFLAA